MSTAERNNECCKVYEPRKYGEKGSVSSPRQEGQGGSPGGVFRVQVEDGGGVHLGPDSQSGRTQRKCTRSKLSSAISALLLHVFARTGLKPRKRAAGPWKEKNTPRHTKALATKKKSRFSPWLHASFGGFAQLRKNNERLV